MYLQNLMTSDDNSLPHNKFHPCPKFESIQTDCNINVAQMVHLFFNLLPNHKILDWSKLKQIADDILKCI